MDTETSESMKRARLVALTALLLACNVAFGWLPAIKTPIIRIGFGFIPVMISSIVLPLPLTVFVAILGDIISFFLFNAAMGGFNVGITLSAAVAAALWSLAFRKVRAGEFNVKKFTVRLVLVSLVVVVLCNLLITTTALSIQLGKGWIALFAPRIWSSLVLFAVHIPIGIALAKMYSQFNQQFTKRSDV